MQTFIDMYDLNCNISSLKLLCSILALIITFFVHLFAEINYLFMYMTDIHITLASTWADFHFYFLCSSFSLQHC